ncbi:MAG: hypothetical protein H0W04_08590 [Chthoniobacterales bacterium]|nr:hypothetical protein [Chthoniobacterales bacterium]
MADGVMRFIQEQNRLEEEKEYQDWHAALLALPEDYKREMKEGLTADIELQPLRWMDLGITLIQSPKVTAYVQLSHGLQGPPLSSYLPYPTFQAGTEIFLKGMYLCRYEDCRLFDHSSYVCPLRREAIVEELKSTSLAHNLLKCIAELEQIPEYRADEAVSRFLRAVGALIRRDYFPAFRPDNDKQWSIARYPKRFYNDKSKTGAADSYQRYSDSPPPFIDRLFLEAEQRVDELWGLHSGLAAKRR